MRVVLWDTRKLDVAKDFAGGFGVGQFPGNGGIGDHKEPRATRRAREEIRQRRQDSGTDVNGV